jgi:hypothetical protein
MPLYEARQTATRHLLVEADSPEEARQLAADTPLEAWEGSTDDTAMTIEEIELPF